MNKDLINSTQPFEENIRFKPEKRLILFPLKWNDLGAKLIPPTAICVTIIVSIKGTPTRRVIVITCFISLPIPIKGDAFSKKFKSNKKNNFHVDKISLKKKGD